MCSLTGDAQRSAGRRLRKLVFVNPTARLHSPEPESAGPAPVELDKLREDLNSDAPATAALAALLAFHAVRVQQLQNLLATDVHDGRLHIDVGSPRGSVQEPARAAGGRQFIALIADCASSDPH